LWLTIAAAEEVRDQYEENGADGGSGEGIEKAAAEDAEPHENPTANEGAHNSKNYIRDATEAAAAGDFSGEPSSDQADYNPAPEPAGECDPKTLCFERRAQQYGGHPASKKILVRNWVFLHRASKN
jgi:hypothetical protein